MGTLLCSLDDSQGDHCIGRVYWGWPTREKCVSQEFVEALISTWKHLNRAINVYAANICRKSSPFLWRLEPPVRIAWPHTCAQSIFLGIQSPFLICATQAADAHTRSWDARNCAHPEVSYDSISKTERDKSIVIYKCTRAAFINF